MEFNTSIDLAISMDQNDPLSSYRDQFHLPKIDNKDVIYFTGNSLGLQPKSTRSFIEEELKEWELQGVEGHFHAKKRPWFHYHKFTKEALAEILGAKPLEVVSMNNLTSNLHLMMVSFYRPEGNRNKILIEKGAFPSDYYAVESQLRFHGFDPDTHMIEMTPSQGEETLQTDDILNKISELGEELALVMFSGVQYYTGQFFDIKSITEAAHSVGAKAGFDLAHAAGNIPLELHYAGPDFAVWCSYKYLNSGPGGVSGIFVHERHANNPTLPRFAGWWGYNESNRFKMEKGFEPMQGADGWQLSNVNVLSTAAHVASLEIFSKVGMKSLREKSLLLTGYMEYLMQQINKAQDEELIKIITPKDPKQRGCQLSLVMKANGKAIFDKLTQDGVIADWREPDVIRVAPVPLYNSFMDVYKFFQILEKHFQNRN